MLSHTDVCVVAVVTSQGGEENWMDQLYDASVKEKDLVYTVSRVTLQKEAATRVQSSVFAPEDSTVTLVFFKLAWRPPVKVGLCKCVTYAIDDSQQWAVFKP
jgi:hypothetical protein